MLTGIVPFVLGFVLQWLMRGRDLPPLAMWLAAASLLAAPLLMGREPMFSIAISRGLSYAATLLINFWFVTMGASAGVALRRWRTRKNALVGARPEAQSAYPTDSQERQTS